MSSLGQELKQARDRASFSVEQIAQQTKINLRLLKALEDERFDQMPEPFFIKGVLKAYVRAIGADEAYFLALYQSEQAPAEPAPSESPLPAPAKERAGRAAAAPPSRVHRPELMDFREAPGRSGPSPKRRIRLQPWVLILLILLLAAAAALVVLFYVQSRPKPAPPIAATVRSAPPLIKPELPAEAAAKQGTPAGPALPSFEAGLKLGLRFTADTWIQVAADGRIVLDGIQAAGREAAFQAAEEFILQIGNAGGVTYTLNGKPGLPFGPSGAVRTDIRISRTNAAEFLRKAPAPAP
jgi:cytoskeleton protein RodZ